MFRFGSSPKSHYVYENITKSKKIQNPKHWGPKHFIGILNLSLVRNVSGEKYETAPDSVS
jgi:hypothetical protein